MIGALWGLGRTRARTPRLSLGLLTAFVVPGAALAQEPPVDRAPIDLVGALPDTTDFVLSVSDLRRLRASGAGRSLEAFLSEMSAWSRSASAWGAIADSIGMAPGAALDELAGSGVVFCIQGMNQPASESGPRHAVMSSISSDTETLLRKRLRPAPRGLERSMPILALEQGAFELSTFVPGRPDQGARVLITPRESTSYFDELLPVLSGSDAPSPLRGTPAFRTLEALPKGPVLGLLRGRPARDGGPDRYLALSGWVLSDRVEAIFDATEGMLLPGRSDLRRVPSGWPARAIDLLEPGALLLIAGSPKDQPADIAIDSEGARDGTLLLALLSALRLSPAIDAEMDGVAILAVHAAPDGGLAFDAAIPAANLDRMRPLVGGWVRMLATDPRLEHAEGRPDSIPVVTLGQGTSPILGKFVKAGGSLAWTFAPEAVGPGGWWVIHIRTAPDQERQAALGAQSLASRLSEPADARVTTQYRLVVHPADLVAHTQDAAKATGKASVFRWIDRVETLVLRKSPEGVLRGRLSVRFKTDLLGLPAPTPAKKPGEGEQPR